MARRVSSDARANSAATVKAAARATAKLTGQKSGAHKSNKNEVSTVTFKQIIVGVVILCFALMLFIASLPDIKNLLGFTTKYEPFRPKNVFVMFEATTRKAVDYEFYYTVERESWYTEENVIRFHGKEGTHNYLVKLPVERIYNLRIDFGSNPGSVLLSNMRLLGSQSVDLSNFENYYYNQFEKHTITPKGQLFFEASGNDPYMIYNEDL